jgi:hypothetical protein
VKSRENVKLVTAHSSQSIGLFEACLKELSQLHAEAFFIQPELCSGPAEDEVGELRARFDVIQSYFAMRFSQAKAYAIIALGYIETDRSFLGFDFHQKETNASV